MKWTYTDSVKRPIKSWCEHVEHDAMTQAKNLANHPVLYKHVALMPDCHVGYGMPIGGVIASENAVIPNAVGVDIGCGMVAVETNLNATVLKDKKQIRSIMDMVKTLTPVGEGKSHRELQSWDYFKEFFSKIKGKLPEWHNEKSFTLDQKNLGTLGGGNHFIELQKSVDNIVWLMIHSGSRNLGHRIATHYHRQALAINKKMNIILPDSNLAYLPVEDLGKDYLRDMNFALDYAAENRKRMMHNFKSVMIDFFKNIQFVQEINIHHNYASLEKHFNKKVWVHRKGATSAKKNEKGIIPGSMGTSSYIVEGLGNEESFMSCSHGAGRVLGRKEACKRLTIEQCDKAMEGIVFDRWSKYRGFGKKKKDSLYDLSESPLAYKNIDDVIKAELDLITPLVKLQPLGVLKG